MNLDKVLEQKVFKSHNASLFNFLQARAYLIFCGIDTFLKYFESLFLFH